MPRLGQYNELEEIEVRRANTKTKEAYIYCIPRKRAYHLSYTMHYIDFAADIAGLFPALKREFMEKVSRSKVRDFFYGPNCRSFVKWLIGRKLVVPHYVVGNLP